MRAWIKGVLSLTLVLQKSSRFLLFLLWVCGQRVGVVQAKRRIHGVRRRLDFVHAGAPHGHRHLIVHRLMWASKIVKGHPRTYASPRLAAVGVRFQMYFFIFDRAPQAFDENVIHEPAASVHRNRDASGFKLAGEGGAGELRALIGVEYPRLFGSRP